MDLFFGGPNIIGVFMADSAVLLIEAHILLVYSDYLRSQLGDLLIGLMVCIE
jgi:hypothetical protein